MSLLALDLEGALGVQAVPYVEADADLLALDPVNNEGIRVIPAALSATLRVPHGVEARLRVEEGQVHAGGLELAEARLGIQHPIAGFWLGRGDLPVSRDRELESEGLLYSTRPLLSRVVLPLHANGVGGHLSWPGRLTAEAGAAWPALSSDAPWWWGRLRLHPLGELPEWEDKRSDTPVFQVAAGIAGMDSPTLGSSLLLDVDGSARLGPVGLDLGWLRRSGAETVQEILVSASAVVLEKEKFCLGLGLRGERSWGSETEQRWIGSSRLYGSWKPAFLTLYVEAYLPLEDGEAPLQPGVVLLDRSLERANNWGAVGLLFRPPSFSL
jgi:hypothetical protein